MSSYPFLSLIGPVIAALLGAFIGILQYAMTRKMALKRDASPGLLGAVPAIRIVIDAAFLAAVYFLSPYLPWPRTRMLVGAVIGLTVPLLIFTPMLVREISHADREEQRENDGPPEGGDA